MITNFFGHECFHLCPVLKDWILNNYENENYTFNALTSAIRDVQELQPKQFKAYGKAKCILQICL
jgi:hypothetical protein